MVGEEEEDEGGSSAGAEVTRVFALLEKGSCIYLDDQSIDRYELSFVYRRIAGFPPCRTLASWMSSLDET
jgi:hypothetical protein